MNITCAAAVSSTEDARDGYSKKGNFLGGKLFEPTTVLYMRTIPSSFFILYYPTAIHAYTVLSYYMLLLILFDLL